MQDPILNEPGGGIRGIFSALMLKEAVRQIGLPVAKIFTGGMGGTSTGGLQVAAYAAGLSPDDVLEIYLTEGPNIFSPHSWWDRYANLGLNGRQFDNHVLYGVMKKALGPAAAWKINDCPTDVMITVGDTARKVWFFVKDKPGVNACTTGKYNLLDVAVATACATTYHDPWMIPDWGWGCDGGVVGQADPVYQTCVEFFSGHNCYGTIDPANARVISLGTGIYTPAKLPPPPSKFVLNRIAFATGSLVDSSEIEAQGAVERHWPGVLQQFNPPIPTAWDESEVSASALAQMVKIGTDYASKMNWPKILGMEK